MEKIFILWGFNQTKFENAVKELLKTKGYEAVFQHRYSKSRIKEFLENNPNYNTVILKEVFGDKKNSYEAEELAQLTDLRDINVIIQLSERRKGLDYMVTLYSAGITNAFFQTGRNGGASVAEVATMILQKRSRKEAREYYGISSKKIEFGFLENEAYMEFYHDFKNPEKSLIENYVSVCARMSPSQIADFTRKLPDDEREFLMQYEEFHVIVQLLKKVGFNLKIKRPKRTLVGLNVPVGIDLKNNEIHIDTGTKEELNSPDDDVKQQKIVEAVDNMSLSDLFGGKQQGNETVEPAKDMEDKNNDTEDLSFYFSDMSGEDVNDIEEESEIIKKQTNYDAEQKKEIKIENPDTMDLSSYFTTVGDNDAHGDIMEETVPKEVEPIKVANDEPLHKEKKVVKKKSNDEEEKLKKQKKDVFLEEDDEEEEVEKITFDDYEMPYARLTLDDSDNGFISKPFIAAVIFLVIAIVAVFIYGNNNIIQLT